MMSEFRQKKFINEPVEVGFSSQPALQKKPGPPDSFTWRGAVYNILEIITEWHNYERRGRMARNMSDRHAARAGKFGSWGVGQDYYRVRTSAGRYFDIYYDRAPRNTSHREGGWFLDRELSPVCD
ncbi:MAG: DUF6504 family protein [Anaerolineales bacterium]